MNEEKDTLFAQNPRRFVIPGHTKNGHQSDVPDLVFDQDQSVPGLYRAKIDKAILAGNGKTTTIKKPKDK